MHPCPDSFWVVHLVIGSFAGLTSLLSVYLTYRSKREAIDRKWFYHQMREKHGLLSERPAGRAQKPERFPEQ